LIKEVTTKFEKEVKSNLAMYEIIRFKLYVKREEFDHCYESYHRYCKINGYKLKSSQKFMITLLNHLTKGTHVYAYKSEFKDNISLYYQLKVIRSLELKNDKDARKYWAELESIGPMIFLDNFQYEGGKDLFHLALSRQLKGFNPSVIKSFSETKLNKIDVSEYKTAIEKLRYILLNHDEYTSKDDLIRLIWNEEWSPKNDARLRTLIYRFKKNSDVIIDTKDGKYKKIA